MCNDRDCNEYVNRQKEAQVGVGRAFASGSAAGTQEVGRALGDKDSYLKSNTQWSLRNPSYTPLLVMMMVELHCFPDRRQFYLYSKLPQAQTEIMDLLRRAQIVVPVAVPAIPGAVPTWDVDDDALKAYIDAVCRVSLPEKKWEVRT